DEATASEQRGDRAGRDRWGVDRQLPSGIQDSCRRFAGAHPALGRSSAPSLEVKNNVGEAESLLGIARRSGRSTQNSSTTNFRCVTLGDMRLSGQKPSPTTRRWTQRPRVVLLGLIGLNIAVFVTQLFLDAYETGFVREYLALSDHGLRSAYGWQFLTAAFL